MNTRLAEVEATCDVCGRRNSWGCGHTSAQRAAARAHDTTAAHRLGWCDHYDHKGCGPACPKAGNPWPDGYAPFVSHAEAEERYAWTEGEPKLGITGPFDPSPTVPTCDVGRHPLPAGARFWLVTDSTRGWEGDKGAACEQHVGDDDWSANADETDDDEDGHDDGDECAKYLPEYGLILANGDETTAEELDEGDVFRDPATDDENTWWEAEEVAEADDEVHVIISPATCERCGQEPVTDRVCGLGDACTEYNNGRVVL